MILSTEALIGQRCDYAKNEIDDFTGERVVFTKAERLASNIITHVVLQVQGKSVNGSNQFLFITSIPHTQFSISVGSEVFLKQEDGNLIKLIVEEDMTSKEVSILGAKSNTGTFSVTIPDDLKSQFLKSPIEKIRIPFENAQSDLDLKKKKRKVFLNILACLHKANK